MSEILQNTFTFAENLERDATLGVKSWDNVWSTYFQFFYSEFDSLRSVLLLLQQLKYKDAFILLRSILEYYFFLVLMIKGARYRETQEYRVIPSTRRQLREERDATYEKWVNIWKSNKSARPEILAIEKGKAEDVILVRVELKGLYERTDVEKKGEVIPKFYFVFDQYDPYVNFLGTLPTLFRRGPSFEKVIEKHRHLYSQFLNIRKIKNNLVLNNLLSREELDRLKVHYNFFSSFTHPTRKGISIQDHYLLHSETKNEAVERLLLTYVAHFQAMLLRLIVGYFIVKNPECELSTYINRAQELERAAEDLWFIYNDPTSFDTEQSKIRKKSMEIMKVQTREGTLYYSDPIERMKQILSLKKSGSFLPYF